MKQQVLAYVIVMARGESEEFVRSVIDSLNNEYEDLYNMCSSKQNREATYEGLKQTNHWLLTLMMGDICFEYGDYEMLNKIYKNPNFNEITANLQDYIELRKHFISKGGDELRLWTDFIASQYKD